MLTLKWALFALKGKDYEWAEREVKQALMQLGGDEVFPIESRSS